MVTHDVQNGRAQKENGAVLIRDFDIIAIIFSIQMPSTYVIKYLITEKATWRWNMSYISCDGIN